MCMTKSVLVACEFSGLVRDALIAHGVKAVSCDLLVSERPGPHIQGDVFELLSLRRFDAIIAFPPCTFLASSGLHWNSRRPDREQKTQHAVEFVRALSDAAPIVCIENPVGALSTRFAAPTQYIQPWEHGHGETKKTCLWLKGLPALTPSNVVEGRAARILGMGATASRQRERSRTYPGVALAMAAQWARFLK